MSRKKDSDAIFIQDVFPNDYKHILDIFSVNECGIKLNKGERWFQVHPEYDLPYKLRNMILSSNDKNRIKSFNQLLKTRLLVN